MKAFTDIEQSKKLAKILPHESADMCYNDGELRIGYAQLAIERDDYFPCWSLAALLNIIQDDIKIEKTLFDQSDLFTYSITSDTFEYKTYEHKELIDACVEMIIKLKEKGLI